jgi:ribonuclease-3
MSSETTEQIEFLPELESSLGYHFQDPSLLLRALTHRSYVNEREGQGIQHNESLEFLGDAVVGFLVSSWIFHKFPGLNEGNLSKIRAYLVSAANLLRLAEELHLGNYVRLSRGEEKTGGRGKRAIVVDAFEALVGAIYLDGGVAPASEFLERQMRGDLDSVDVGQLTYGDFKSVLQERLHDLGRLEPVYRVVDEIGPDHRKTFVVEVEIAGQVIARATGKTKKEAQQDAARLALESLNDGEAKSEPLPAGESPDTSAAS